MCAASEPRRRFLQFRLRTLLVLMLAIAAPLAWVSERRRKQDQAIATIERLGGRIQFRWKSAWDNGAPRYSMWLRRLVGDPWLAQSLFVSFSGPHCRVRDADLACLADLPHLTGLALGNTRVSDPGMEHIAKLRGLETLGLDGTRVHDFGLALVEHLPYLRHLALDGSRVTYRRYKALQTERPEVVVTYYAAT
jgi:hypothetical protein